MSKFKETEIESKSVYKGALLDVYRDEVRVPDGGKSVREWIKHPGASAVVALFDDGTTILIKQFRYPPQKEFIEVPAGKLDFLGEDPEDVAKRELEEETGWLADKFTYLGPQYPCIGYSNEVIHFYLAEGLREGTFGTSEGEFVEPFRIPFSEAVEMANTGKLLDMKTWSAIKLAEQFLSRRNGLE